MIPYLLTLVVGITIGTLYGLWIADLWLKENQENE